MKTTAPAGKYLLVLAILLLATGLRFYRLDSQSFWNDEGNSARLSERSLQLIIEGTASDIHPPFYYIILRAWRELVGESEFGLRSFSAFAGVMTVAGTYALTGVVVRRGSRAPEAVAALLAAVNPALVYYSQEARMYALLALLAALSTFALMRWLQARTGKWAIGYVCLVSAGLYTHYFFPAVFIAHNLVVAIYFTRTRSRQNLAPAVPVPQDTDSGQSEVVAKRQLAGWAAMMGATFLLYLPWLPIFVRQAGGRDSGTVDPLSFLLDSSTWIVFGGTIEQDAVLLPFMLTVFLVITAFLIAGRKALVPAIILSLPLLFMLIAGTTQTHFYKFLLVAVPFLAVLVSLNLDDVGRRPRIFLLALSVGLLVILATAGQSLQNLYFNPSYARADYRSIARRIADEDHPNAGIILSAPNQWEVFTYYHRDGAPVYPIPTGRPIAERIEHELSDIAARHDRLYAIFWGERLRDPEGLVEKWLDTHAYKAIEEWIGDVRFVTYAVPAEASDIVMEETADIAFGDGIRLKGYSLLPELVSAGDIVQVTLFWETNRELGQRYKVFLHLVSEGGRIVAQRDGEPGGGSAITTSWTPGDTIIDNHGILIPVQTPAGDYTLLAGLYELFDPDARLAVHSSSETQDAVPLGVISVE